MSVEYLPKAIKLTADEGMIICSKSEHYDEEHKMNVPDVVGKLIFCPLNTDINEYYEIEEGTE